MQIGPRTGEMENQHQHCWTREINGTTYGFVHVKISRTRPRVVVTREDPDGWADVHRYTT